MVVLWVCDAIILSAGIGLIGFAIALWSLSDQPVQRPRRRVTRRHPVMWDGYDRTEVRDGITYPSKTLAALIEKGSAHDHADS